MKKLLKSNVPTSKICANAENNFSSIDIADIIQQIEELKNYNVAVKRDDEGRLLLAVGDSIYEISEINKKRYPRRAVRKLET